MTTLLVNFVLDESISMMAVKPATISGFNEYVKTLRQRPENILLTLTKFNTDRVETVHEAALLQDVDDLTDESYQPASMTPLYDAIGRTISVAEAKLREIDAEDKLVLTVIQTDGQENSSKEFDLDKIKRLIEAKTEAGWEFAFIGADMDEWEATRIGIVAANFQGYHGDAAGVQQVFHNVALSSAAYGSSSGSTSGDFFNQDKVTAILDEEKKSGMTQWQKELLKKGKHAAKDKD